jgi:serine protease inhibitor
MARAADSGAGTNGRMSPPKSFAEENNDFTLALYEQLRQRPGNLFFSPFGIRAALGMAEAGANGETASQMRGALHISSSDETRHVDFARISERLNAAGVGEYEMRIVNSLWCQDGASLKSEFLDLIARHYGGDANLVDFEHAADSARETINHWVEEKTRQKIRDLIAPGGIDADTRLVLVNAVYFKGKWVLRFLETATRDEPFYLEGGGTVQAPLMRQEGPIWYLRAEDYQAVDLRYRGGDLSMLVLLPDRREGLRDLERALSTRMLNQCMARTRQTRVKLFFPRFKVTWGASDLKDQLTALGMPLAFARFQADFSGINGREPPAEDSLFISTVVHKAFVEANEEGTEAAAATAALMAEAAASRSSKPPPVPVFRADHPFLFAIRDWKTNAILFLGRIMDPTRAG